MDGIGATALAGSAASALSGRGAQAASRKASGRTTPKICMGTSSRAGDSDMRELAHMLDTASGPYVEIVTEHGNRIVLDVEHARASAPKILKKHGIARDRSSDLLEPPPGKSDK